MIIEILTLACAIEAFTIYTRHVFGPIRARLHRRHWPHVHHLYLGILALAMYTFFYSTPGVLLIGGALTLSDAVHHFVTLPFLVGETEFP